jgi:Kef-type K+ transport system membrane component KefB
MIFIEKSRCGGNLLLPFFCIYRFENRNRLINDPYLWKVTGAIILVAWGKFLGSAVAAKFVGQNWKDSNWCLDEHKGLMELIVLNIGLELKVLTPEVFTMMVIMALVTTFMTGPALDLINYLFKRLCLMPKK